MSGGFTHLEEPLEIQLQKKFGKDAGLTDERRAELLRWYAIVGEHIAGNKEVRDAVYGLLVHEAEPATRRLLDDRDIWKDTHEGARLQGRRDGLNAALDHVADQARIAVAVRILTNQESTE